MKSFTRRASASELLSANVAELGDDDFERDGYTWDYVFVLPGLRTERKNKNCAYEPKEVYI